MAPLVPSELLIPVNTPVLLPNGKMDPSWWAVFVALAEGFVGVVTVTGSSAVGDVAIFSGPEEITGGLVQTANYADASVILSKIQNAAASSKLLGSGATGAGSAYSELTLGTNLSMSGTTLNAASGGITQLTGDVTAGPGSGSVAATIPNTTVTLAKMQNAAANSKLLGSGSAGAGSSYSELTLGTNLSMSGTTLNASAGASVTAFAPSFLLMGG